MTKKKDDEKEYRTIQFFIKEGNPLNSYLMDMMYLSNNLFNTTNFYIRQVYTGIKHEKEQRHELQNEVIELFEKTIPAINKHNIDKYDRLIKEDLEKGKDPSKRKLTEFKMPTAEQNFVSYGLLDAILKTSKNKDYTSLPAHVNQGVMKAVYSDWSSFFEGLKKYKVDPSRFKGRPKPPKYKTKGAANEVYFSNQVCTIKEDSNGKRSLKFPKTKLTFNLSKHLLNKIDNDYKLVQVRAQNIIMMLN